MTRVTPMCECYGIFKQNAELQMYIRKMNLLERVEPTHFMCAPITVLTVKDEILGNESKKCPFCQKIVEPTNTTYF